MAIRCAEQTLLPIRIRPKTLHHTQRQEKFLVGTAIVRTLFQCLTSGKSLCGELMLLVGRKDTTTIQAAGKTAMPAWYHGQDYADPASGGR